MLHIYVGIFQFESVHSRPANESVSTKAPQMLTKCCQQLDEGSLEQRIPHTLIDELGILSWRGVQWFC